MTTPLLKVENAETYYGNIRALIAHGLAGVKFAAQPLTRR